MAVKWMCCKDFKTAGEECGGGNCLDPLET